jgi:hypothetical protein
VRSRAGLETAALKRCGPDQTLNPNLARVFFGNDRPRRWNVILKRSEESIEPLLAWGSISEGQKQTFPHTGPGFSEALKTPHR